MKKLNDIFDDWDEEEFYIDESVRGYMRAHLRDYTILSNDEQCVDIVLKLIEMGETVYNDKEIIDSKSMGMWKTFNFSEEMWRRCFREKEIINYETFMEL